AASTVVGSETTKGTAALSAAAPAGGAVVMLATDNAAASVPVSVSIAAGATSADFSVTTNQVPLPLNVTITATYQPSSKSTQLTVGAIPICGPFLSAPVLLPFGLYFDSGSPQNHFIPGGWIGDISDLSVDAADTSLPHSGTTAMKIGYAGKGPLGFA